MPPDSIVSFRADGNVIAITGAISRTTLPEFCYRMAEIETRGTSIASVDLSGCTGAFPDGLVPIAALVTSIRDKGVSFSALPPLETRARKILDQSGLLHIIQPEVFRRSSRSDRNLPITKFSTYHEVHELSREFVELAIRALPGATHDFLTGLEWATNEVMDNVLNHADSDQGGFVQAVVLPDRIAWAVADTGQGILASLREGFPMLANDTEAVAEAVKAGVTRNKEVGQGNGLAGTLSISLLSGGTFSAHSGQGGYDVFIDTTDGLAKNRKIVHSAAERYPGTFVGSQILKNPAFRLADALGFASPSTDVFANDVIESRYESDDAKSFVVRMASETSGFGSRHAGKALRTKCLNLIRMEPSKRLVLDWAGVSVISSSYADEFVAKMVVELGFATFSAQCTLVGMVPLVRQLIDKAIFQRVAQASPYGD